MLFSGLLFPFLPPDCTGDEASADEEFAAGADGGFEAGADAALDVAGEAELDAEAEGKDDALDAGSPDAGGPELIPRSTRVLGSTSTPG